MKDKYISWEQAVLWLRSQPEKHELVKACYFDDPLSEAAKRYYFSNEWKAVQKILTCTDTGSVLDLGAGRGISSYALARDGWQVTALEPDSSMVVGSGAISELAEQTGLKIKVIEEFGEKLPFGSGSFDMVFGRAVLHHARNMAEVCLEISRVLKPGGLLLVTREHVISKKEDLQGFLDDHPLHALYGGENAFMLGEYIEAIESSGMTTVKIIAPYDSEINLYPDSFYIIRKRIRKKIFFNIPNYFFKAMIIPLMNWLDNTPGRLYSFLAEKSI